MYTVWCGPGATWSQHIFGAWSQRWVPIQQPKLSLRVSTSRTELRGLHLLARAIAALLPGLSDQLNRTSLIGNSQCAISAVECDQKLLNFWFRNRVAKIIDHMQSLRASGVVVNKLPHWLGEFNIAEFPTKGKANIIKVLESSERQEGPLMTRKSCNLGPATRSFVRKVPEEETRSRLYQANRVTKTNQFPNSLAMHALVVEIRTNTNSYNRVLAIITHLLMANKFHDQENVMKELTVHTLDMAEHLTFIVSAVETDPLVKACKMDGMAPYWSQGLCKNKGSFGKSAFCVLGGFELPILTHTSRSAKKIMIKTHLQDHKGLRSLSGDPEQKPGSGGGKACRTGGL